MKPFIILTFLILCVACVKNPESSNIRKAQLDLGPQEYMLQSVTNEINLGKVLFYDPALSANNSVSCASCHKQVNAFADNIAESIGFKHDGTPRNSMGINSIGILENFGFGFMDPKNLIEAPVNLFWDGRANSLKELALQPALHHEEMGMKSTDHIVETVLSRSYYQELIDKAYPNQTITLEHISEALALFMLEISAGNSKFEQSKSAGTEILSPTEQQGMVAFKEIYQCNNCHLVDQPGSSPYSDPNIPSSMLFRNIGLDKQPQDEGRFLITNQESDKGKFRVPTLTNVEFTGPYMHDGRFETLEEVLDFYSHGVQDAPNLDPTLIDPNTNHAKQLNITEQDKKNIVAFLKTFSDVELLTNPSLSSPFNSIP